jgi:hypothetical protein
MNDRIKAFADFISKQVNEGVVISEDKEKASITKKVANHIGIPDEESDFTVAHVASHGNHHTYSAGEAHWSYDGEPAHYATHDSSTGKTHDFTLPPKKLTVKQVHAAMNKAVPGGVSEEHAKAVADEHNG